MENLEPTRVTRKGTLRRFTWSFHSRRRIWEALQIVECLSGHELSEKFFRFCIRLETFNLKFICVLMNLIMICVYF